MHRKDLLEIHFKKFDDFKQEIRRALSDKKKAIQPKNQIYFDSPESYRKFMTIQKIELLSAIARLKPTSIYELAKVVDRDFAAVLRDCIALEGTGFISLEENEDSRGSKTPKLSFSYSAILIHAPGHTYKIEFETEKEAA